MCIRDRLDTLAKLNQMDVEKNPGNSELSARISAYELAYRMQGCAPEVVNIEMCIRDSMSTTRLL